jgi:hypothetical protein
MTAKPNHHFHDDSWSNHRQMAVMLSASCALASCARMHRVFYAAPQSRRDGPIKAQVRAMRAKRAVASPWVE